MTQRWIVYSETVMMHSSIKHIGQLHFLTQTFTELKLRSKYL